MNKKIYSLMLGLLTLTGLLTGCKSDDDITFDHERQQFETRADRILLEFIAPFGTTANEEVYIIGPFNGNTLTADEEGKYADPVLDDAFKLTKAPKSDVKWGIYLDPATFQNGKSLADGFRFYSKAQGNEALLGATAVYAVHNDNPGVGTFTNVWGQRWEAYYWSGGEKPEPDHNGVRVYVDNQTGWDALTLYMWGDVNDLNGGWPGMQPTGQWEKDGVKWTYFDLGEENMGLNENLIFNNNGGGSQLPDFNLTLDHDVYLRLTADAVEEIELEPSVKHDGYAVFVYDETGWDALNLYMWGDTNNLNGDWPGMEVTGEQTINGVTYKVVPCHFKTNIAVSATTVYAANEYFQVTHDAFTNTPVAFADDTQLTIECDHGDYFGRQWPVTMTFYTSAEAMQTGTIREPFKITVTEGNKTTTYTQGVNLTITNTDPVSVTIGGVEHYTYYRQRFTYYTQTINGGSITAKVTATAQSRAEEERAATFVMNRRYFIIGEKSFKVDFKNFLDESATGDGSSIYVKGTYVGWFGRGLSDSSTGYLTADGPLQNYVIDRAYQNYETLTDDDEVYFQIYNPNHDYRAYTTIGELDAARIAGTSSTLQVEFNEVTTP